ncbi:MAG: FtsH protease activity modulator HflK [Planctomycetes bacterium]|nr:FtsH protease activity modulator HflK [Planctomycetota bacterium]
MSTGGFGRQRGRPFDPEDIPWDKIIKWVPLAVALLLVLFFGTSMFYRIEASDEGVVLQFGAHQKTVPPGLHWKLPWPIETVYKVPVQRIQTLEFGFETDQPGRVTKYAPAGAGDLAVAEMLTGDLNLGHVEWIVQYRIKDPFEYLFNLGGSEQVARGSLPSGAVDDVNPAVPDTIRDVSESVVRKLVGDTSVDAVLTFGRDKIASDAKVQIQEMLDRFQAGVEIVTVKLQTTSPPTDRVKNAFQEVNRARQNKERVVNDAEGQRNLQIRAKEGARDQAISEAEGYRERVVLETDGKIEAFKAQFDEYKAAREVTRKRLYLEAMEEILAKVGSKTIIDESVRGVLPVLNLDQAAPLPAVEKGVQR